MEGVMRGGNHHSRGEFLLPDQAGNAGSRDDARGEEHYAVIGEPGGKLRGDMGPGFARIHADQDARLRVGLEQVLSQRPRDPIKGGVVQRISAGNAANAVSAEQFLGHRGYGCGLNASSPKPASCGRRSAAAESPPESGWPGHSIRPRIFESSTRPVILREKWARGAAQE